MNYCFPKPTNTLLIIGKLQQYIMDLCLTVELLLCLHYIDRFLSNSNSFCLANEIILFRYFFALTLKTKDYDISHNGKFKSNIKNKLKDLLVMKKLISIAICLVIFSCKKEKTTSDVVMAIGQNYGGGIVFYVDGTLQHGLIAAESDQSASVQWYNGSFITTNTFEGEVGRGGPNTAAIVSAQGTGIYAASICDQLVLNGFSDWFLPSKNELNLLYQ